MLTAVHESSGWRSCSFVCRSKALNLVDSNRFEAFRQLMRWWLKTFWAHLVNLVANSTKQKTLQRTAAWQGELEMRMIQIKKIKNAFNFSVTRWASEIIAKCAPQTARKPLLDFTVDEVHIKISEEAPEGDEEAETTTYTTADSSITNPLAPLKHSVETHPFDFSSIF